MAAGGKAGTPLSLLIWRLAAGLLAALCLALASVVWWQGEAETEEAFASGRRILVALVDGQITDGRAVVPSKPLEIPSAPADGQKPADPAAAPPPAEGEKPPEETAPKAEAPPAETPPEQEAVVGTEVTVEVEQPEEEKFDLSTLPPAPVSTTPVNDFNPSLAEKTEAGTLPTIASDGTKPWRHYAKPYTPPSGTPMIAIVVTGLGQSRSFSENAMKLPENITLSFSPYAKELASWGSAARATGHEIMLDLPLEPTDYPVTDPGPYGIMAERGAKENDRYLEWTLARLSVYSGVVALPNESFSASGEAFRLMLQSLANRGVMLLMGREPAKDETKDIIDSSHTATVVADMQIDEDLSVSVIQARLASLEQQAKKSGHAVGIAHAYPVTIEQIYLWSQTLKDKGIVLVPLSTIARLRFS